MVADEKVKVLVAKSCPTLCEPMDSSLPGSSVHGILQARILEWVTIPFSRASSPSKVKPWVSCITGRCFTVWGTREVLLNLFLSLSEVYVLQSLKSGYSNTCLIYIPHWIISLISTCSLGVTDIVCFLLVIISQLRTKFIHFTTTENSCLPCFEVLLSISCSSLSIFSCLFLPYKERLWTYFDRIWT